MAKQPISVPYQSYDYLGQVANEFLLKYDPAGNIPVPIEEIIDLKFEIDIVPTPGLHRGFDIDAFITSDLSCIYVDEFVYESRPGRYRFSLAHEMAHLILHRSVYEQLEFMTIQEWKDVITDLPPKEYLRLEWQANNFAGLLLVPRDALAQRFERASGNLYKVGLTLETASDAAQQMIHGALAQEFVVSPQVIEIRAEKDGLWRKD